MEQKERDNGRIARESEREDRKKREREGERERVAYTWLLGIYIRHPFCTPGTSVPILYL